MDKNSELRKPFAAGPFGQQFRGQEPLSFRAFSISGLWSRQVASEARSLMSHRSIGELETIGHVVNQLICAHIETLGKTPVETSDEKATLRPKRRVSYVGASIEDIRSAVGDTNLFSALLLQRGNAPLPGGFAFWEGYATLALWKLADAHAALRFYYGRTGFTVEPSAESRFLALRDSGPFFIEATLACTLALEGRLREQQRAALENDAPRAQFPKAD